MLMAGVGSLNESTPVPLEVTQVRKYQHKAFLYISQALELDEKNDEDIARIQELLMIYKKGMKELKKGLSVILKGDGDEFERAKNLQCKMQANLPKVEDRIAELETILKSVNLKDGGTSKNVNTGKSTGSKKTDTTVHKPSTSKAKADTKPSETNNRGRTHHKGTPPNVLSSVTAKPKASTTKRVSVRREMTKEDTRKVNNMKNVDSKFANLILNEVVESGGHVSFDDIGGVETAKKLLHEIVVLPSLRPELFTGLRAPARGLLLFGPPGNGKTLLAKALASEANAVFFNISAATLTSKFVGEGEKMVRAMFAVARELQPSIIFMDEIDSLLTERKESEHDASRRLKTEFLLCFDGVISDPNERILIMGATNRPWELDNAALRRLVKRVYVPLPSMETRQQIVHQMLKKHNSPMGESELNHLARVTEGYSGSDLAALARDAALMPIRELDHELIKSVPADKVRNITVNDFLAAMNTVRPSVSASSLKVFEDWNKQYGTL